MINEVYRRIRAAKTVIIDVETDGLDWRHNKIVGYVFTFSPKPQDSFYLPVRHETGPNYDPARVKKMLIACQDEPRHWVGHHLAFDLAFISNEGIQLNGTFEDTMINECLCNELEVSYSLSACADRSGVQAKLADEILRHIATQFGGEPVKNRMGEYWKLAADDPVAVDYAVGDGTSTWQLWEVQQSRLDIQSLREVWGIECRLIPVLNRMTMRGIKIDEDMLHRVKDRMEQDLVNYKAAIGEEVNARSPNQMVAFFTKHGVTDWPKTAKGNPSFPEEWLLTSEIGRRFVKVRQYGNILSSFITPMLERHLYCGRVHPQFNQLKSDEFGTVTGRLSSSNPNVQQVPKRNMSLGIPFRAIFVPDDGMIWGSADYSQCEPRLLAYYSGCRVLIDGYNANPPVDAHTSVARSAGIDRQSGKRLNQALLTGAGIKKATLMLGKPPGEAEEIVEKYFASMPEIKDLQKTAAGAMLRKGFVRSILGRRARLEARGYEYKAVNRLLQCSNADMIKKSMVLVDEHCRSEGGIDMLNNVHDSLDFQFLPEKREAYEHAKRIMCDFPIIDVVPIEVEDGCGHNWSIASYGEEDYNKIMAEKELV
jgi:DNA polymerase I-like protein with 3'-5' exonuclease and polymerase domains